MDFSTYELSVQDIAEESWRNIISTAHHNGTTVAYPQEVDRGVHHFTDGCAYPAVVAPVSNAGLLHCHDASALSATTLTAFRRPRDPRGNPLETSQCSVRS